MEKIQCEECDSYISKKRLKALPNTKLCIQCAKKHEKAGDFTKSHIEINPQVTGWEFDGINTEIIKGD